ncbi:MAG TPA: CBS domain-containing protein [Casimicrobiaceae bacterium]|nr:CBS domain-containing protein [Casimicrobiaceae bacterium]
MAGQPAVTAGRMSTVFEAATLMKQKGKGALLVLEGAKLIGIVTERDIVFRVVAAGRDPRATPLADVMTPQPQSIHPDKPFHHALQIMHRGGFRHVPVVENERPLGIVSARDALDDDLYELRADLALRAEEQD